jgi:hypothetical protein
MLTLQDADFAAVVERVAHARRGQITSALVGRVGNRVIAGPFAGMQLPLRSGRGEGDLATRLLGCYEAELHPAIEKAIARRPVTVVNVGCGDGYYAAGLALRLPGAHVFAFDIDEASQEVSRQAAALCGVGQRVTVGGECTPEALRALAARRGHALLMLDCEGAERDLLSPPTAAALGSADVIVECHDFVDRSISPTLCARFAATHAVERIREAGRDPSAYPILHGLSTLDRWIAVCEFRPETIPGWPAGA